MALFDRIATGGPLNHDCSTNGATRHAAPRFALIAMAFSAVLAACGGSSDSDNTSTALPPPAPPPAVPQLPGSVSSRALSSSSGQPVVGAEVTVGAETATTASNGTFSFLDVPQNDRLAVALSAPGYAPNVRYSVSTDNLDTIVPVQLTPVAATLSVDAAVGGALVVASAQVVIPAAAIVTSTGAAPTQTVDVQVTPIRVAQDSSLLTGDYRVSADTWLQTHGAMSVVLTDASLGSYDFAAGQGAAIRIPVSSRATNIPPLTGLFRFDESTGLWVNQGNATLAGVAPNQYYTATATHPGTWAAGTVLETVPVTGCVQNTLGQRVSRARVESDGVTYSGTTTAITDSAGNFSIAVRTDADSVISARRGRRVSNYATVRTEKVPRAISTGCLVLADAISIKLTWGTNPLDVDSHLITPHDTHISYLNLGALASLPYSALDVDDKTSNGPEIVTVRRVVRGGTYRYYVDNYSSTYTPGMTGSPVRVEVSAAGYTSLFTPPAGEGFNDYWHAFDIVVDANCNISVNAVGTWSPTPPGNPTQTISGPITYCPND